MATTDNTCVPDNGQECADDDHADNSSGRAESVSDGPPGLRSKSIGRIGDSAVSLRTLVSAAAVTALVIAVGVLSWQLRAESADLREVRTRAADAMQAEQVALDYATGAAEMDFRDLAAWRSRLTAGTTPALAERLTQAATAMEQIISPLQWVSTAEPVTAKVRSEANGVYSVDCFVRVLTKNAQATDGIQSTATYQMSIDRNNDWTITDIGGVDSALAVDPK